MCRWINKKSCRHSTEDIRDIAENYTFNTHLTLNHRWRFAKTTSFPIVTMVMRDKFDYFFVQKSQYHGVNPIDQTRVTFVEEFPDYVLVTTEKGNFKSKVIIGADGVTSLVARSLEIRKKPKLGAALEGEIFPINDSANLSVYDGSLHLDFNVIPKGYGWIFPKRDHLSVGVFTTLPKVKEIKRFFSF